MNLFCYDPVIEMSVIEFKQNMPIPAFEIYLM